MQLRSNTFLLILNSWSSLNYFILKKSQDILQFFFCFLFLYSLFLIFCFSFQYLFINSIFECQDLIPDIFLKSLSLLLDVSLFISFVHLLYMSLICDIIFLSKNYMIFPSMVNINRFLRNCNIPYFSYNRNFIV